MNSYLKNLIFLLLIISIFSCSDSFLSDLEKEKLAGRQGGRTFTLESGTFVVSFNEGDEGFFKARLSELPEHDVILDFSKSEQMCTTPGVRESLSFVPDRLIFTPLNYNIEQEVKIIVNDDEVVQEARHHRINLPSLESNDTLYNGVNIPIIDVTVFDNDTSPMAFPATPYFGETDASENKDIIITFNREMDVDTFNNHTVILENDIGSPIPCYIRKSSDKKKILISPKNYLQSNTEYFVKLSTAVKDIYGNSLMNNMTFNFKTRMIEPKLRGQIKFEGITEKIFISGNYGFVTNYEKGLIILDISDPASITIKKTFKTSGTPLDVYVYDNKAFIADGSNGLYVVDISNISSPSFSWGCPMDGDTTGVIILDGYAYVSNTQGLKIVSLANKSIISSVETPGDAVSAAISGSYVFIADGLSGIQVVDISDKNNPFIAVAYDTPGYARAIKISGKYLYVAVSGFGLKIFDISQPIEPRIAGEFSDKGKYYHSIYIDDNSLYIANSAENKIDVLDITIPDTPRLRASYKDAQYPRGVFVKDSMICFTELNGGVKIIDRLNVHEPVFYGQYDFKARQVKIIDNKAFFLSANEFRIVEIDFYDISSSKVIASWQADYIPQKFVVSMPYVYISSRYLLNGIEQYILSIINIADLNNIFLEGSLSRSGCGWGIDYIANNVCIANDSFGLEIIDVSNPQVPVFKSAFTVTGLVSGITVKDNHVFLIDWANSNPQNYGLKILDISDPFSPELIGSYNTPGNAQDVLIQDNFAFVSDDSKGLQILDITNLTNPVIVKNYITSGKALHSIIYGHYLYVSCGNLGMSIVDISNPANPVYAGSYDSPGNTRTIDIIDNFAVLADSDSVLFIRHPYGY